MPGINRPMNDEVIIADLMRAQRRRLRAGIIQTLQPAKDRFTVAASPASTYTLSAIPYQSPLGSSLNVSLNGDELVEGVDYTVDYTTAILTVTATLKGTPTPADVLTADYWTTGDLIAATVPSDFGSISDGFVGAVNQHLAGRATSDGHATWVVPQGDFLTDNPGVQSVSFQSVGYIETNATDGTVQCDITPDTLGAYYAVMVRYVDTSNYWYFEAKNVANTGRVIHFTAGTAVVAASGLAVGGAGPFTMKVVMTGDTLQFYNGASLLYTDTSGALDTATKHGIWANNNGVGHLFLNWSWTG